MKPVFSTRICTECRTILLDPPMKGRPVHRDGTTCKSCGSKISPGFDWKKLNRYI